MEKLGYIVTKKKVKYVNDFIGVVGDISLADPNKPTLIVGLEEARKCTDNFCILEKQINENLFWTFDKHERREDYEKDFILFNKYIILNILNKYNYKYINILLFKYNNFKNIINILYNNSDNVKNYMYINNEMLYILHNEIIYGLSLKIMRYGNINTLKFLDKLKLNKNNIIYDDANYLATKIKKNVGDNKYIIPYFMSIELKNDNFSKNE